MNVYHVIYTLNVGLTHLELLLAGGLHSCGWKVNFCLTLVRDQMNLGELEILLCEKIFKRRLNPSIYKDLEVQ